MRPPMDSLPLHSHGRARPESKLPQYSAEHIIGDVVACPYIVAAATRETAAAPAISLLPTSRASAPYRT